MKKGNSKNLFLQWVFTLPNTRIVVFDTFSTVSFYLNFLYSFFCYFFLIVCTVGFPYVYRERAIITVLIAFLPFDEMSSDLLLVHQDTMLSSLQVLNELYLCKLMGSKGTVLSWVVRCTGGSQEHNGSAHPGACCCMYSQCWATVDVARWGETDVEASWGH